MVLQGRFGRELLSPRLRATCIARYGGGGEARAELTLPLAADSAEFESAEFEGAKVVSKAYLTT